MTDLPVIRKPDVPVGTIYWMPQGSVTIDLKTGIRTQHPAGVYASTRDLRTDSEIQAAAIPYIP